MKKMPKLSSLLLEKNNYHSIHRLFEEENHHGTSFMHGIDVNLGKNIKLNLTPDIHEKLIEKTEEVLSKMNFSYTQFYDNSDFEKFRKNFMHLWKDEAGINTLKNSIFNIFTPSFKIKLDNDHFIKSIEIDVYKIKNELGHDEAGALIKFQL
jgi:hypothetical protein